MSLKWRVRRRVGFLILKIFKFFATQNTAVVVSWCKSLKLTRRSDPFFRSSTQVLQLYDRCVPVGENTRLHRTVFSLHFKRKRMSYSYRNVGRVLVSLSETIKAVGGYTRGVCDAWMCDARPTVIFPVAQHCHCRLDGTHLPSF